MAAVAVARGSSFMFSKQLLETMEPLNLLGVRSLLAFAVLMVFFGKRVVKAVKEEPGTLRAGALIGFTYFIVILILYILFNKILSTPQAYRNQFLYIVLAIVVVVIVNAMFLFVDGSSPVAELDISILGYSLYEKEEGESDVTPIIDIEELLNLVVECSDDES